MLTKVQVVKTFIVRAGLLGYYYPEGCVSVVHWKTNVIFVNIQCYEKSPFYCS